MRTFLVLTALVACGGGSKPAVEVTPSQIAWGDIDFQMERPDEGYQPVQLTITNITERDIDVVIQDFDDLHLALNAPQLVSDDPPTLSTLSAGQAASIGVAVWDYEPGERDSEVSGSLRFAVDGAATTQIPWSFTPIRIIDTDTFQ